MQSSFHIIWSARCFAVPLGMSDYGNWTICTDSRFMAYAFDLDVLLHYQVQCACSAVLLLATRSNC